MVNNLVVKVHYGHLVVNCRSVAAHSAAERRMQETGEKQRVVSFLT